MDPELSDGIKVGGGSVLVLVGIWVKHLFNRGVTRDTDELSTLATSMDVRLKEMAGEMRLLSERVADLKEKLATGALSFQNLYAQNAKQAKEIAELQKDVWSRK